MSELDKTQQTPQTAGVTPGPTTATNPTRKLTVSFDANTNKFFYAPEADGNLSFLRKPGDAADFTIEFERGEDQKWEFVAWMSFPPATAPGSGKPVLELDSLQAQMIRVTNRIEYNDVYSHTYKYTFVIKRTAKDFRFADPEIQNRRELTTTTTTDH